MNLPVTGCGDCCLVGLNWHCITIATALAGLCYADHDVLEIDDRHRPTNREEGGMWEEWNLGEERPRGNIVETPPWWETYKMHSEEEGEGRGSAAVTPRPPRELAERLSRGAVYRDGEWRDADDQP